MQYQNSNARRWEHWSHISSLSCEEVEVEGGTCIRSVSTLIDGKLSSPTYLPLGPFSLLDICLNLLACDESHPSSWKIILIVTGVCT